LHSSRQAKGANIRAKDLWFLTGYAAGFKPALMPVADVSSVKAVMNEPAAMEYS
jgi:hypothetical protein